jgi:hypothetical protein
LQDLLSGPRISDAWFAALAIEHGCVWITCDRDYTRFPDLDWREPRCDWALEALSAQKLKDCCAASGGPTRTPSSSSMRAFVFEPPGAEKPPILPPAASTR